MSDNRPPNQEEDHTAFKPRPGGRDPSASWQNAGVQREAPRAPEPQPAFTPEAPFGAHHPHHAPSAPPGGQQSPFGPNPGQPGAHQGYPPPYPSAAGGYYPPPGGYPGGQPPYSPPGVYPPPGGQNYGGYPPSSEGRTESTLGHVGAQSPSYGGYSQAPAQPYPAQARALPLDINPLVASAANLFTIASQLSVMGVHADIPGLRQQIENEIRRFDMSAREKGLSPEYILEARYALCSLMDEVVLNTPWGSQSNWTAETLLSTFHQETWGGDKFFEILNRRLQEPARALDVIEFLYLCISLGFIGKYRIRQGGFAELEMLRQDVYNAIQRQRGAPRMELSPHWASSVRKQSVLRNGIPLWAIGAVAGALLLVSYIGFSVAISGVGDLVMNQANITAIRDPEPVKVAPPPPPQAPLAVCGMFEREVKARILEVSNEAGGCLIRLVTSGLFASGSDRINPELLPVLERMSEELGKLENTVRVVGHTDKVPIVTARFQSNWALSQARAKSVAAELARGRPNGAGIETEGKADSEPLVADEKTPEDRARNRRVEIFVLN